MAKEAHSSDLGRSGVLGSVLKLAIGFALAAFLAAQTFVYIISQTKSPVQTAATVGVARPTVSQVPAPMPPRSGSGEITIRADNSGQYFAEVEIDGTRIHMLVDTGASAVALSHEDAAALGFYPAPADYKFAVRTANGTARVARVRLPRVRLGPIVVYDVEAFVGERGALGSSLLGMTFLSKLSRVEAASGALVLEQ